MSRCNIYSVSAIYILCSILKRIEYQSFGPLSIQCKKNVLIPRWETEEWTSKLANRLTPMLGSTKQIKIVDICTGSGCIALLLACLLPKESASIQGVDISPDAISLAQRNKADNRNWLANEVEFSIGDLFSECISTTINLADVIVSNPPYVSAEDQQSISLSTRRFEPKIALIAENGGDAFYVRILDLLEKQCQAKWLVLEVGSQLQANRVEGMMLQRGWRTEIWRDGAGVQRCVMGRRSLIPG